MEQYIVKEEICRQLARDYLKRHLGISGTLWKKIKKQNDFWVNGEQVIPGRAMVEPGDEIRFSYPVHSEVRPVAMALDILYEDDYLLAVNKPGGQLTHPLSFEQDTSLANGVMAYFEDRGIRAGCHPIYRLDRNTSGIVIFAKVPQLQFWWAGDHGKLQREYLALAEGHFRAKTGSVDAPIGRAENSIILQEVSPEGKEALTHYEVLKEFNSYSLVRLHLETGRTHQIRVHMSYLGHPLLGDDLYGGSRELMGRHALHAVAVRFRHPFTQEEIILKAELPEDMANLIK